MYGSKQRQQQEKETNTAAEITLIGAVERCLGRDIALGFDKPLGIMQKFTLEPEKEEKNVGFVVGEAL